MSPPWRHIGIQKDFRHNSDNNILFQFRTTINVCCFVCFWTIPYSLPEVPILEFKTMMVSGKMAFSQIKISEFTCMCVLFYWIYLELDCACGSSYLSLKL